MKHFQSAFPRSLLATLLLATLLGACSGGSDTGSGSDAGSGSGSGTQPSQTVAPQAQPTTNSPGTSSPDTQRRIAAPGAVFTLPADWVREQPASAMRLAQAQIPGSGGPGQLTAFHFGAGGGGGMEANLQRWIGQMEATAEPTRDSFTLGNWKVTWVEVVGTLKPSSMGFGPSEPQPGSRLLGAVIEGEGGPWFFKATGPADTLAAQRDAFLDLLKSGRPQSAA